jgi:acyl dehydratase
LLVMENEGRNQRGELVFSFTGRVLVERRNPLVA